MIRTPALALALLTTACASAPTPGGDAPADTAVTGPTTADVETADTGAPDSGVDTDTDTAADTDTDTAADTDTAPPPAAPVLVMPGMDGIRLVDLDGELVETWSWDTAIGGCSGCTGEGASADGDGLLVSFAIVGGGPGPDPADGNGIARITADGQPDWVLHGFEFPHDAVRDPADGSVFVPESKGNRVTWVAGDGSSDAPLRSLSPASGAWWSGSPNGAELVEEDGRRYALLSHRGSGGGGGAPDGGISLWDVTDPDDVHLTWRFPTYGWLDTPHGAALRFHEGQWVLLYAHTYGDDDHGTVGVAVAPTLRDPPAYAADLVPGDAVEPFVFLRGVDLTDDGTLYLTDSGSEKGDHHEGRLVRATLPSLTPSGASGAVDQDQVFATLQDAVTLAEDLPYPFEGWVWDRGATR